MPDAMRGQPAQIEIHLDAPAAVGKAAQWIAVIVVVLLLGVGVIIFAVVFLIRQRAINDRSPAFLPTITRPTTSGKKDQPPGFATVLLDFGSEGIGPGMFKDARSIAVDGSGKIYVGEYIGGRIQVFDPVGKFLTQWTVDLKMPLRGLAADRKGTVYVVQRGNITRYEGETGKLLGEMDYAGGGGFDDLSMSADGGFVAAWYSNRDDVVRFNSAGEVTRTIRAAISSTSGDSELNTRVAIDGLGNIYALGTFNNAVFKFGPDGKFLTRFGDAGEQPGQFRAPSAIAVDGKGRVYVSDIKGIQLFDGNGRYLKVFKPDGMAFGMVFTDNNELLIAARKHVVKYAISE